MCLAIPAQIVSILKEQRAIVNLGGIERDISTALLDDIDIGDFVIVHVGYALSKLDEVEAKRTLQLFADMLEKKP